MSRKKEGDFRSLSQSAQAALRKVALRAIDKGSKQKEVSELVGVTTQTVSDWVCKRKRGDKEVISGKKRGRNFGDKRIINAEMEAKLKEWIKMSTPESHNIKSALWSRKSINALIKKHFGFLLPLSTIGEYLKRWGYSSQKPKKLAYEQQQSKIQEWLDNTYPEIEDRAKKESAEIHWGDETGIRSECQVLKGYAPKGKTPIIKHTSKRFRINMASTVSNNGKLRFMLYESTLDAKTFVEFLRRLVKYSKKKIFLILDNVSVHHSEIVQQWVKKHKKKITLFFLPPYSPQYNPDEYLNNNLKRSVNRKNIPLTKKELKSNLKAYLKYLQCNPKHVQNLFQADDVQYAA